MSYTKGPWNVSTNQDEMSVVCELHTSGLAHFLITKTDVELGDIFDDANLIAAAPDLYEALNSIIENTLPEIISVKTYSQCVAALKKARGEQ